MLLYASGKGTSISGNLEMARRALESGQAKAKLAESGGGRGIGCGRRAEGEHVCVNKRV